MIALSAILFLRWCSSYDRASSEFENLRFFLYSVDLWEDYSESVDDVSDWMLL